MERVSVIKGNSELTPIILIAPHGAAGDDEYTAELTEMIATNLNCWAIINRGFERAEKFDYFKDKADCNNINHCLEDVVRDEFMAPIVRAVNSVLSEEHNANIFLIHGMSNAVRTQSNDDNLDIVLGYGAAAKPSYSCDLVRKDAFIYLLDKSDFNVYNGKSGGKFAAASKQNLNQYFRKHDPNPEVHSMQLEIVKARRNPLVLEETGESLTKVFEEYQEYLEYSLDNKLPSFFRKGWESIPKNTPEF